MCITFIHVATLWCNGELSFSHKFSAVQTVHDKFAAYVAGFN